jgi:hypothetical protein
MLTYNKMMKLHNELESSLSELQRHLEVVLEDFDSEFGVSAQIRVDEGNCLTISYYDPTQNMELESIIADSLEFKRLIRCQTPEELLAFLSQRTIA